MRRQDGYTLAEMVVVLGILALLFTLATVAGVGFVMSARMANTTAQIEDSIVMARHNAMARYEQWRVRFLLSNPNSNIVHGFVVESCALPTGSIGTLCNSWVERRRFSVLDGLGIQVEKIGDDPVTLVFDRTGYFYIINPNDQTLTTDDVEITICAVVQGSGGHEVCRPGSTGRMLRIRQYSGIIES